MSTITADLSWRLLRGGGRRDLVTQLLAVVAFAVSSCLFLVALAVNVGFAHRADRAAWTTPVAAAAGSPATAVASTTTDFYDGRPITVVTLAALSPSAPVPPGLPAFPTPGQRWTSPGLTALIRSHPAALHDRWPGRATGRVGAAGLTTPDQLLVVVGVPAGSSALRGPVVRDAARPSAVGGPVRITGFANHPGQQADTTYRDLSLIGSVLLVVPLLVLGGAASRLGLARRDHRLAVLRLVGASSRQIVAVVATESAVAALAGALFGAVAYSAAIPLISRLPVAGGRWSVPDLWVGAGSVAAVLAGVTLAGILSAVATLRRVVVSPLGVTHRHEPRGRHLWRGLVFVGAVLVYLRLSRTPDASLTALVLAFGIVFLTLSMLGPLVLTLLGKVMVAGARRPARLLAGRRILDDPRGAWRTVGGLAMTGFVAGFLALFPTSTGQVVWGSADVLDVAVPAARLGPARAAVQLELREAGLRSEVGSGDSGGALLATTLGDGTDPAAATARLSVPVTEGNRELTRTAVHRALPGAPAATGADVAGLDDLVQTDIRRASTVVLIASFLVAIASAGITAAAAVLDRRRTYQLLSLAGTPLGLLDEARRQEITGPLLLLVTGSIATGLVVGAPVTRLGLGGGRMDSAGLLLLAGTVAAGVVGVRLASAASRPLLRAVVEDGTAP